MADLFEGAVEVARKRLGAGALVWGACVILVGLSKAVGVDATARLTLFLASVVALAVGAFQCINTSTRPFLGHWEADVRARILLIVEAVLGLLLVIGGLDGTVARRPQPWILTLIYLPPALVYWQVEVDIAARVIEGGKRLGTSHVMGLRPFGGKTLAESATIAEKTPQGGLLVRLFGPLPPEGSIDEPTPTVLESEQHREGPHATPLDFAQDFEWVDDSLTADEITPSLDITAERIATRPITISVTRIWVALALAVVFLACLATTTVEAAESVMQTFGQDHSSAGAANTTTTRTTTMTPTQSTPTPSTTPTTTPSSTPVPAPSAPQLIYWSTICKTLPGAGAPDWATQALFDFYLGANGVGALEGGCTGRVTVVGDDFAYEVGADPATGALESIAVVSKRWPGAIFLRPLAMRIRRLIDIYGSFGGSERHDVVNGDYQLAYVAAGTVAFVRETKADASGATTPYVELPPAVADDWFVAMQGAGWLWPELLDSTRNIETFRFVTTAVGGETVDIVRYDRATGRAFRQVNGQWLANVALGDEIADASVEQLAAGAR